MLKNIDIR